MKKLWIILGCVVLCAAVCICIILNIEPEKHPVYQEVDALIARCAQDPNYYLGEDAAALVLKSGCFEKVKYSVCDEEYSYTPLNERQLYWISHCKAFGINIPLTNEESCRSFLWLLWHCLGQIRYSPYVPLEIIHYPAQNAVLYIFENYELSHDKPYASTMEVLVSDQTNELLYLDYS